jgi:hypothetical protein
MLFTFPPSGIYGTVFLYPSAGHYEQVSTYLLFIVVELGCICFQHCDLPIDFKPPGKVAFYVATNCAMITDVQAV